VGLRNIQIDDESTLVLRAMTAALACAKPE
jgi:hypothetical protein